MGILAQKLTQKKITKVDLEKVKELVISRILSISSPSKIIFFGSAIKNTMTEASDYDFAILYKNELQLKREKKEILQGNLFKDIQVDLLFFTEEYFNSKSKIGGICFEIQDHGVVIYDQRTKV